jgi:acetylornithine deacetylase/succinyl-diaminopimelate desuccinylase-like protein
LYGGAALNALHALHAMLSAVVPGRDGRVREELRAGVVAPAPAELESWAGLKPGEQVLSDVGGRPLSSDAAREFYVRNWAEPSLDVNEIVAGEPRTVIPVTARCTLSLRLAPRQSSEEMSAVLRRLLLDAAPEGTEVEIAEHRGDPALFDVDQPVMRIAAEAIEHATRTPAAVIRSGGSIPIVADLAARGIPTIVSGFALPEDRIHAPDESYRLRALELGEATSAELLKGLAALR